MAKRDNKFLFDPIYPTGNAASLSFSFFIKKKNPTTKNPEAISKLTSTLMEFFLESAFSLLLMEADRGMIGCTLPIGHCYGCPRRVANTVLSSDMDWRFQILGYNFDHCLIMRNHLCPVSGAQALSGSERCCPVLLAFFYHGLRCQNSIPFVPASPQSPLRLLHRILSEHWTCGHRICPRVARA